MLDCGSTTPEGILSGFDIRPSKLWDETGIKLSKGL
jgi:hypothetical protein